MPSSHPFARRRTVDLSLLSEYPLVSMPSGTGIRAALDIACAHAGFTPRIAVEASAADAIAELAARDLGVGVLSVSMAEEYRDRVAVVRLKGNPVPAVLAAVWSASPSPAVRAFTPRLAAAFGR